MHNDRSIRIHTSIALGFQLQQACEGESAQHTCPALAGVWCIVALAFGCVCCVMYVLYVGVRQVLNLCWLWCYASFCDVGVIVTCSEVLYVL